jgi:hypothetical protein
MRDGERMRSDVTALGSEHVVSGAEIPVVVPTAVLSQFMIGGSLAPETFFFQTSQKVLKENFHTRLWEGFEFSKSGSGSTASVTFGSPAIRLNVWVRTSASHESILSLAVQRQSLQNSFRARFSSESPRFSVWQR